ncbi:MAG: ferrochelatase [Nitrospira sp.]
MSEPQQPIAILLMAVGGPDKLDDVEPYLLDVRGGRPTPKELVEEIKERYRATGGKTPVLAIMREVAAKLTQQLNGLGGARYRVHIGFRHWHPYIKDVYAELANERPEQLIGICMAPQYSSMSIGAYIKNVEEAKAAVGAEFPVSFVQSWHDHPKLIQAIAANITEALQKFPADVRGRVPIFFTAHSLPERVLQMKDPYPDHVKATMDAVCKQLGQVRARFAYQSQGRSSEKWLGPTTEETLDALAAEGHKHVLMAPIGFISDHVEVLYDIDIELKERATKLGIHLERIAMLNATPPLINILASLIEQHQSPPAR